MAKRVATKGRHSKYSILNAALNLFLEKGYSNTSVSMIGKEVGLAVGTIVFHFPAKEDMLVELVKELCDFQWKVMEQEVEEGKSSLVAYLLELATMASMTDENVVEKDLYVSAYTHSSALNIIRKNDTKKAKMVFGEYCPDWTEKEYIQAENAVSGIEYAMFMSENTEQLSLDERIAGSLDAVMKVYELPRELREAKIKKVLAMDYKKIGRKILKEFSQYVAEINEQALQEVSEKKK